MLKLILLFLIILSIPSSLVLARFLYKRGNQLLEGHRLALRERELAVKAKEADYTDRLLK